ncbi:hypothetical protein M7I_5436 [Glarea lozoyensis 74030]|uniref:Uncharacterized protein n=1 Tax=Glarea lozoyensis (strain ATCC 74030 / MF5533) TaxID=1104152 RepID=H0ERW4_GLAL7|nr:hypothetical protein M7I_5436 [Glarea lozoyensis 74030]
MLVYVNKKMTILTSPRFMKKMKKMGPDECIDEGKEYWHTKHVTWGVEGDVGEPGRSNTHPFIIYKNYEFFVHTIRPEHIESKLSPLLIDIIGMI